ncbi:MAG: eL32 family ribosomal protein [Nanoarchaeota archaeon]|nr:eL32 family ribosomal protein [Nanoarchaeota archaeon]
MVQFLRRDARRFSKFGKGRGKKATWKKPKGRDNKMREKRKGYPAVVSIGYGSDKKIKNKFEEKEVIKIMNAGDLEKIQKNQIGLIGSVGKKKKLEIAKKAKEMKIKLRNMNAEKYLTKNIKENTSKSINKK